MPDGASLILNGLAEQALFDVSHKSNGFSNVDVLEVTDKGQEVEFWDRKDGAYIYIIVRWLKLKNALKPVQVA